jgi:hypothetical protein
LESLTVNAPFRSLVVALAMTSLTAACGGDSDDQMTLREIASRIECTDLKATRNPDGNKDVLRVGTCARQGDGVIITTYASNEARDKMVRKMDDGVTALIDKGDRWTAFASPEVGEVDSADGGGENPVEPGATCDAAREAFLNGTDEDIVAALEALLADTTVPAAAREAADAYLYGDAGSPDRMETDKQLILTACDG